KSDGTYVVEFRTAGGETLAISIPASEAAVVRYFQERMPYGLFVPDLQEPKGIDDRSRCQESRSLVGRKARERTSVGSWTRSHGYEPTRAAAMAAFAKSWRRE